MEIMVGYVIGLHKERILRYYWDHLSMVERVGRYYSTPLKGHQRITQGDTLSLKVLKMVVGAVIHHWVMLVVVEEAGPDGFGWAIQ